MKIGRVIKLEKELETAIRNLYRVALSTKMTSLEINKRCRAIKENCPKSTPRYVFSYFDGMRQILRSEHKKHLEFCYTINGKIYSIEKNSPRHYEKFFKPSELQSKSESSGFYYRDTDKPYFVSKDR